MAPTGTPSDGDSLSVHTESESGSHATFITVEPTTGAQVDLRGRVDALLGGQLDPATSAAEQAALTELVTANMDAVNLEDEHREGVRKILGDIFDTFVPLEKRKGGGGRGRGQSSSSSSSVSGGGGVGSGAGTLRGGGAETSGPRKGNWFLHPKGKPTGLRYAAYILYVLIGAVSLAALYGIYKMVSLARRWLDPSNPDGIRVLHDRIHQSQDSARKGDVELGNQELYSLSKDRR